MKFIPVIKCRNMEESISFYTHILDFDLKDPDDDSPVRDLIKGEAELQLSVMPGDGLFGTVVNVRVDNIDDLFRKFVARGLDINKPGSPVHQGPLDQSWGMREFYVTDPNGNTLRFGKPIE